MPFQAGEEINKKGNLCMLVKMLKILFFTYHVVYIFTLLVITYCVSGFADQIGVAAGDHVTVDDHVNMADEHVSVTDDHVSMAVADF